MSNRFWKIICSPELIKLLLQKKKYYYIQNNCHGKYIIFRSKWIIKHISKVYQSLIC